jgi:ribosomal protein S18 acetylase RimI-like enzyme
VLVIEIRRVNASELDALHALRLEALAESPGSFGSTYAIEVQLDPVRRRPWVTDGVAVVAEDAKGWHGLATGTVADGVVNVFAMWVRPDRRHEGIGRRLLLEVIEWGKENGASRARLGVVDDNEAAAELYDSVGFMPTGERERLHSDPSHDVIYHWRALS